MGPPNAAGFQASTKPTTSTYGGRRSGTEGNMNEVGPFGKSTWAKEGIALLAVIFSLLTAGSAFGFGEAGLRSNPTAASASDATKLPP